LSGRFHLNNRTGRVDAARWAPSPNFDDRPAGTRISALVIHCISLPPGVYEGDCVERFFLNELDHDAHPYFEQIRDMRVSAHFLIRRSGELIQLVSTLDRAWHAGASSLAGAPAVNDFSIGIELEGVDYAGFAAPQYRALGSLAGALVAAYPQVARDRVVGHCDIAPGRKTDPGPGFEWSRLYRDLGW